MDLSRPAPSPARYTGIAMVVALHLAGIYALSAGLIKPPTRPTEIATLKPLPPDGPKPQPTVEPLRPTTPHLTQPAAIPVPVPPQVYPTTDTPMVTTAPLHADAVPTTTAGMPVTQEATRPAITQPSVSTPGAVCSVMPRPEVPVVSWSGEAVLQVVATVRGGRVTGSDMRVTQGAPDSKTRRALQRSVETALAGYQCQGDALFQQDFAFRVD